MLLFVDLLTTYKKKCNRRVKYDLISDWISYGVHIEPFIEHTVWNSVLAHSCTLLTRWSEAITSCLWSQSLKSRVDQQTRRDVLFLYTTTSCVSKLFRCFFVLKVDWLASIHPSLCQGFLPDQRVVFTTAHNGLQLCPCGVIMSKDFRHSTTWAGDTN